MNHLNLKFSCAILIAIFAVTWSSVVLEENSGVSAPIAPESIASVEEADEDTKQQGGSVAGAGDGDGDGDENWGPGGGRPRRCPTDRGNCFQTRFCARRCTGSNTGNDEACDNGGLGQYCDEWCRYAKGPRFTGRGDRCWCHCIPLEFLN